MPDDAMSTEMLTIEVMATSATQTASMLEHTHTPLHP